MLYIVATPIGNLGDITIRALEILKGVDGVICEDSRRTSLLLNHFQIKKPLIAVNNFNEAKMIPEIVQKLQNGQNIAMVSDAGTPLISDPGYKLVRECLQAGIEVDSLPGPSAIITALTLSGLPPDKFMFLGYLPEKPGHRIDLLKEISKFNSDSNRLKPTFIIYIAPHKLQRTLMDIKEVLGDIEVVLASELTKIYQKVDKKRVSSWLEKLTNPKGEYVLLFSFYLK